MRSSAFWEHITNYQTLLGLGLMILIFQIVILPGAASSLDFYAQQNFDKNWIFWLKSEEIIAALAAYGEKGRKLLVIVLSSAGILYELVVGLLFIVSFLWLRKKHIKLFKYWNMLPFLLIGSSWMGCLLLIVQSLIFPQTSSFLLALVVGLRLVSWFAILANLGIIFFYLFNFKKKPQTESLNSGL